MFNLFGNDKEEVKPTPLATVEANNALIILYASQVERGMLKNKEPCLFTLFEQVQSLAFHMKNEGNKQLTYGGLSFTLDAIGFLNIKQIQE